MRTKRKPGRPRKFDFKLKKGESVEYPYSASLRVNALNWARLNNVEFTTVKTGEILTIKRTQ
jgi:hypothetical protein